MSPMGICDACDALGLVKPEPFAPFFGPRRNLCPKCWQAADNFEPSDRDMQEAADAAIERGDSHERERQRMRDAGRGNQVGR